MKEVTARSLNNKMKKVLKNEEKRDRKHKFETGAAFLLRSTTRMLEMKFFHLAT